MGCFATEENTEDDNPPIGINYSRRRFKMKSVTRYFRNAVAASMQGTVNYKKERFFVVTEGELLSGKLSEENNFNIWKKEYDAESDNDEEKLKIKNVIIALKTLATEFRDGGKMEDNIEEMTSFFFLPLCVTRTGKLCMPVEGKIPWIPREYLRPMEDPLLAVGDGEKYDEFLEHTTNERYQLDSWQDYLAYAIKLYEFVAEIPFKSNYIRNGNELFKADGRYYLFQDSTVNASFYILQLYNALIKGTVNSLYDKITNGKIEPSKPLIKNTDISKMKAHVGQMGGAYPLSPSQREAMNHFGEIKEGNLLAVSGPPGTGKTTFLQSVVADMYVKSALKRERAPIIVAASTNNQAVTNIIDSFGQISEIGISNLEHKWITGTDSFAVYFPSNGKVKEAAQKRYQYTTVRGGGFVDELESKENRRSSGRLFKQEFHQYFRRETASIDFALCEEILWKELEKVNKDRINCISMLDNIKSVLGRESYGAYVERIMQNIRKEEAIRNDLQNQIEKIQETTQWFLNRMQEWRKAYQQFPWYVRLLKKFFCFKSKIQRWSFKAVIVGDEEQIPPVWGTARALDIAMAISNGVIANKGEYGMLEENGLNCSQSSIMKMAALSCEFNKYKRGLFLSEHRRCYNEIITYCNKLVYEGKLEPKRGSFYAAEYNELRGLLPVMGFRQVTTAKSEKYGGSRRNREEAEAIIMWLQKKYEKILLCYSDKDGIEERGVLGIITPFKSQSFLIKNLIKRRLPEYSKFIDVGTVHTFQGAERKVILFSSVYGSEDGCYFINRAPDLMNVAVSRAKDSFLVFGDKECLTGGEKTAAGLLKKMVFVEGEELC